jgi:polar amino acid transport system permease protein
MTASEPLSSKRSTQGQFIHQLSRWPWWLLFIFLAGVFLFYKITTDELYSTILGRLASGIGLTLRVALAAFAFAILIGLIVGLGRVSKNPIIFNLATLYVQIIRGVPILVQIIYVAYVIRPLLFNLIHSLGTQLIGILGPNNFLLLTTNQDITAEAQVVFALAIAYGGYEAETFRAGIESISKGQMEAARSLGMSYFQAMRYVILPQAVRRVLPPLGNDFVSMIKDSSLVSVLGVRDVTQEARLYAAASFRYPETYNTLAFVYLSLTISLSLGVKFIENRWGQDGRSG